MIGVLLGVALLAAEPPAEALVPAEREPVAPTAIAPAAAPTAADPLDAATGPTPPGPTPDADAVEPGAPDAEPDEPAATPVAEPAKLVDHAPPPPETRTAAVGAGGQTPLPAAPPPEDPATVATGPWRGRYFMDFEVGAIGPVGGARPARGNVVSAHGSLVFGGRVHPLVGLGGGITTFVHDSETRVFEDDDGMAVAEKGFGRITLFDLAVARVFWPAARRVEPWAELGGGIGLRRRALLGEPAFVGSVRAGLGVDFWLGPTFTLGVGMGYRALFVLKSAGHALQGGARFTVHW